MRISFFQFLIFLESVLTTHSIRLNIDNVRQDKPWASGCRMIYLDVGSNVGVQIRKLFEPSKYPKAGVHKEFNKHFGFPNVRSKPTKETGLCAIGFEANPQLVERLQHIETIYNANGWRVKFMAPFAVSDVDSEIPFYLDQDKNVNQWGSSVVPWQGPDSSYTSHRKNKMSSTKIKTLNLSEFLNREVFAVKPQKVLMKMDIEGSEFIVLPDLIRRGYMCRELINEVFMEWHVPFWRSGMMSMKEIQQQMGKQKCDLGASLTVGQDDESYLLDGQPLPEKAVLSKRFLSNGYQISEDNMQHHRNVTRSIHAAVQKDWITRQAGF